MPGDGEEREDLAELLARRALTEDAARADAVERRHAGGGRTARENIADLVDPGSFVEYGRFAIAAQRGRREVEELIERTPADGLIGGTARVNGELFGERAACAVLSYDYTVLAGTQGALGHRKKDRLFELIERMRLPTVFYAEGGGGRPGDTDYPVVSALDTRAFALWAKLSGLVPRIAVVAGRCFAGNAVIAGCSDLIVATENVSLGMGGPAMIEGGGLGRVDPDEVGPIAMQAGNGVVDVVAADEAEATAVDQAPAGLLPGRDGPGRGARPGAAARGDPGARPPRLRGRAGDRDARRRGLGHLPARALRAGDGDGAGADRGAAAAASSPTTRATSPARSPATPPTRRRASSSSATPSGSRSSRWSTRPGSWSGRTPRRPALVRHASRLLVAGAALRVPLIAVILRRGYGLGAQAMVGGSLHEPLLTVAWPSAHLGPDGPGGRGAAGAAQGAGGDRRRGRARAAGPRPHRRRRREREGAERGGAVRARRRDRPGRDARR